MVAKYLPLPVSVTVSRWQNVGHCVIKGDRRHALIVSAGASVGCSDCTRPQHSLCVELMKRDDGRCNMTELCYDAPLATFDGDEWSEFLDDDVDDVGGRDDHDGSDDVLYADSVPSVAAERRLCSDGFAGDAFCGSLEDLVSCFDDNVRRCFRNYSEDTELIAPVQIRTREQVLHESQCVYSVSRSYYSAVPMFRFLIASVSRIKQDSCNGTIIGSRMWPIE